MNMKLYAICFKMRGGPDVLDLIQTKTPVPVDMMEQVMALMDSVTPEETAFAEKLDTDWKKAFNERVPLLMTIAADGGYDISCEVPDELLSTVSILYGMEPERIVEEYTADYLKNVCGVHADIISVDMEKVERDAPTVTGKIKGFDLSDLAAVPEKPAFENVSEFMGMETVSPAPAPVAAAYEEPAFEEPAFEEPAFEEPAFEEPAYEEPGMDDMDAEPGMEGSVDDGIPDDMEEAMNGGEMPVEDVPDGTADSTYQDAVRNIYTELVGNIRDRGLDERLNLRIGQYA